MLKSIIHFTSAYMRTKNTISSVLARTAMTLLVTMLTSASTWAHANVSTADGQRNAITNGSINYIECSWDANNKTVKNTTMTVASDSYTMLSSGGNINLDAGTYVASGKLTVSSITCKGKVKLILCDDALLTVNHGIRVNKADNNAALYIYSQSYGSSMGKIKSKIDNNSDYLGAAIGSSMKKDQGRIEIHGGHIYAEAREKASELGESGGGAGIGSGYDSNGGEITIYGGRIEAKSQEMDSAIGTGGISNPTCRGCDITIYGGDIDARSDYCGAAIGGSCVPGPNVLEGVVAIHGGNIYAKGNTSGAGIGSAYSCQSPVIIIYGGEVRAFGGNRAAGIGGGRDASGAFVIIYGGNIEARGGDYAAGIGSGCEHLFNDGRNGGQLNIHGGHVEAYGGIDGAGIGGGEDADGGIVEISGGYVYAEGKDYGAGIGGGEDGDGGDVTITGGTVIAKSGILGKTGMRGIGPGYDCNNYGKLTIGDKMMVRNWNCTDGPYPAASRKDHCWYRTQVRLDPCDHQDHAYTVSGITPDDTHLEHCQYCTTAFEAEKHHFVNGKCTVCDAKAAANDVSIYLPKHQGGGIYDGETYSCERTFQMVYNSTLTLPPCPTRVPGLEFKGWLATKEVAGDTYTSSYTTSGEKLLNVGDEYTIMNNVCFIARYQVLNIRLADNADNSETLVRHVGMTASSVTLSGRMLYKDGSWNMLCLPFALNADELAASPLAGCTLKELDVTSKWSMDEDGIETGFDSETGTLTLCFKDASSIEAGKPYLVKWDGGTDITDPMFNDVKIDIVQYGVRSKDNTVAFVGNYSPKAFTDEECRNILYLTADNTLHRPDANTTVNSFRAFFQVAKGLPSQLKGDVNGDGTVSVADVTLLVNIILGNEDETITQNADINGDGIISIADITALTDIILNESINIKKVVVYGAEGIRFE